MLFRVVRPMRRDGSRNRYYVRRIPVDVRSKVIRLKLTIPQRDNQTRVIIPYGCRVIDHPRLP
jgi:hypothetical protein